MLQNIPGYQPGTYVIDGSHSNVTFSVRHMMVAKVRGEIEGLEGTIVLAEQPEAVDDHGDRRPVDHQHEERRTATRTCALATSSRPRSTPSGPSRPPARASRATTSPSTATCSSAA